MIPQLKWSTRFSSFSTGLVVCKLKDFFWGMLKQPALISLDLYLSVINCKCWTYDDNIGPRIKKAELCNIVGVKFIYLEMLTFSVKTLEINFITTYVGLKRSLTFQRHCHRHRSSP